MDKRYVRWTGRKGRPNAADHLKKFQFKKGESGQTRLGKTARKTPKGEVIWEGEDIAPLGNPDYVNAKKAELEEKKKQGNPQNLMPPWKPGQSGNPNGRPVGSVSLVERLKAYLRRHPEEVENIVKTLVKEGKMGNMVATKEMLDRIDGRVVERHKLEAELPVKLLFVPAQELLNSAQNPDEAIQDEQDGVLEGEAIPKLPEGEEPT